MTAKVFIVKYANEADYKVFFVEYDSAQKNHQILAGGKLVRYASEADVKVFVVRYSSEANICIMRKNFPK